MNCERYEELIHLYVDHRLDKKEEGTLLSHMETCTHCRETYEEISALKDLLGGMQMKELPEGFEEELHVKLVEASVENDKSLLERVREKIWSGPKMKMAVSFGAVAIAAVFVIGNTNLVPSMKQLDQAHYEMAYEASDEADYATEASEMAMDVMPAEEAPMAMTMAKESRAGEASNFSLNAAPNDAGTEYGISDSEVGSNEGPKMDAGSPNETKVDDFKGRLIIKTANINMDVENYDETSGELSRMVEEMGGYISDTSSYYYIYDRYNESENKKSGYMTLRIPHQFFDQFVSQMNTFGDITDYSSTANDITKHYRDTSAEVENLEVREAKLREIMGKAEAIEDIIEVERELSRVRSEINRYKSVLTDWEDLVTLSTITIGMTEVEELKERVQPVDKDMLTKAKEGFIYTVNRMVDGVELFVIWFIAALPVLVPVVIVSVIVIKKLIKRWK
jgi:hypothetical protein